MLVGSGRTESSILPPTHPGRVPSPYVGVLGTGMGLSSVWVWVWTHEYVCGVSDTCVKVSSVCVSLCVWVWTRVGGSRVCVGRAGHVWGSRVRVWGSRECVCESGHTSTCVSLDTYVGSRVSVLRSRVCMWGSWVRVGSRTVCGISGVLCESGHMCRTEDVCKSLDTCVRSRVRMWGLGFLCGVSCYVCGGS